MSQPFLHDDFLLDTPAARELYHRWAAPQPIIDFHNHLPPRDIAEDRRWENLTQLWLEGDHYKWRAMRTNGIPEHLVTGPADDWERFQAFAATVPRSVRNPLYHWTALELKRYFGIDELLSPETARRIWDETKEKLKDISARSLLRTSNVETLCTTDDPVDSLEWHRQCAADTSFPIGVYPAWRPDKGMAFHDPAAWHAWKVKLEAASGFTVKDWTSFQAALTTRQHVFAEHGCRLSDHGLETFWTEEASAEEIERVFATVLAGQTPDARGLAVLCSTFLLEEGRRDHATDWTQQYHYGPLRNVCTRLARALGPDVGGDIIGPPGDARRLAAFLDRLDREGRLTRTIIYNIHPGDNEMVAALIGAFQDGSIAGKVQFGSGWWFNDQLDGMTRQLEALSQMSLLSCFVGMLTDSRSFLSFTRHEYFRRLLCRILGREVEEGLLPRDYDLLGNLVADVCYRNAKTYFKLPPKNTPL